MEKHGVVLHAAWGRFPSLAETVAGERIAGSWWGHPKGKEIFRAASAIAESTEILVCKLVEGHVTYVHRRLWPALVKLSPRFSRTQLARVWDEHTPSGAHRSRRLSFPRWVPAATAQEAASLSVAEAEVTLAALLPFGAGAKARTGGTDQARGATRGRRRA